MFPMSHAWELADEIIKEEKSMKVYALKYKGTDVVGLYSSEYQAASSHRWEDKSIAKDLSISYGTFTEEGTIEFPMKDVNKEGDII
jgi:hypothetical protein